MGIYCIKYLLYIIGIYTRNYAAAATAVHTKCKLVNGVYVITLDSPGVKVYIYTQYLKCFFIYNFKGKSNLHYMYNIVK